MKRQVHSQLSLLKRVLFLACTAMTVLTSFHPITARAASGDEILVQYLEPADANKAELASAVVAKAVLPAVKDHKSAAPEIVAAGVTRIHDCDSFKVVVKAAIDGLGSTDLIRQQAPKIVSAAVRAVPFTTCKCFANVTEGSLGPLSEYLDEDTVVAIVSDIISVVPASCSEKVVRAAIGAAPQYASALSALKTTNIASGFDKDGKNVNACDPVDGGESNTPPSLPPPFVFPPPPGGGLIAEVTPVS